MFKRKVCAILELALNFISSNFYIKFSDINLLCNCVHEANDLMGFKFPWVCSRFKAVT